MVPFGRRPFPCSIPPDCPDLRSRQAAETARAPRDVRNCNARWMGFAVVTKWGASRSGKALPPVGTVQQDGLAGDHRLAQTDAGTVYQTAQSFSGFGQCLIRFYETSNVAFQLGDWGGEKDAERIVHSLQPFAQPLLLTCLYLCQKPFAHLADLTSLTSQGLEMACSFCAGRERPPSGLNTITRAISSVSI